MELSCKACAADPQLKALSGCEEPTQVPVWETGEDERFYSCPMLYIPETVSLWYEELAYMRDFGGGDFWDRESRWLDAYRIYNSEYNMHHEERLQRMKQEASVKASVKR